MVFSYMLSLGDNIQPAAHGNGVRSYDSIEDLVKPKSDWEDDAVTLRNICNDFYLRLNMYRDLLSKVGFHRCH